MVVMKFNHGRSCPYFECEVCGGRIETRAAAIVYFLKPEGESSGLVVHKGRCHDEAQENMEKWTPGVPVVWQEMADFLVNVTHNTGMDLKALEKHSKLLRNLERQGF